MRMSTLNSHKSQTRPGTVEEIPLSFREPPFQDSVIHIANSDSSELYEVYTPNSSGSRSQWKNFAHYKSVCSSPSGTSVPFSTYYTSPDGFNHLGFGNASDPYCFYDGGWGVAGRLNSGLPAFVDETKQGEDIVPPPAKLDEWLGAAFNAMLPYIRPKTSLVNSILELKDIKSIPHTARNLKNFYQLVRAIPAFKSWWLKKTFRDLLRVLSDLKLQYNFNLAPLKSDIEAVWTALSRSEKRLNALMSRAGRPQRAHYMRHLVENENSATDWSSPSGLGWGGTGWSVDLGPLLGSYSTQRFVTYEPSVFHAELEYSYTYASYQSEHARMLGLFDDLGVNLNPAIIWNALPWSFVVDWVAGVSQWLSDQRLGWMDPSLNIRRGCWSIRRQRSILVHRKFWCYKNILGEIDSITTNALPIVTETAYRRHCIGLGDIVTGLKTSGLNSSELSLTAALVFSRRSRHRGHRK